MKVFALERRRRIDANPISYTFKKLSPPSAGLIVVMRIGLTNRLGAVILFGVVALVGCSSLGKTSREDIIVGGSGDSAKSNLHLNKGIRLYQHGKLSHATVAFHQAIDTDPSNGSAHNNLGLAYYEQRKLFLAATHFDTAAKLRPEDPTPLNNLGMTMEAAGKGFEAMDYYHNAHELDPLNPMYLGNLVRTRIRLGDNDESVIGQLKELLFIEDRPDWIAWINEQLALDLNPYLDRGPATPDLSSSADKNKQSPTKADQADDGEYDPSAENEYDDGSSVLLVPPQTEAWQLEDVYLEELPASESYEYAEPQ